jgi:PAS domain S-box-containing protein
VPKEHRLHIQEQNAIVDSKAFLDKMNNTIPSIIYIYNIMTNKNEFISKQIKGTLGYTTFENEQLNSLFISNIVHPEDSISFNECMTQVLRSDLNQTLTTDLRIRHKNGNYLWFSSRMQAYESDKNGQVIKILGSLEDRSAQKRAEEIADQEKLKYLQTSKFAVIGQLAGGIAHEINNPLASISAQAQLLKSLVEEGDLNSRRSSIVEKAEKIENTTKRISKIIKGLKDFSRTSGREPLLPHPIENIINEALNLCFDKFSFFGVKLHVCMDAKVNVPCRNVQLSQVLLNLLHNSFDAVEHLPEKWIRVKTSLEGEFVLLTITDSGSGIKPDVAQRLMTPFFTTKEVGKGTGLGLSISSGIVSDHGGQLYLNQKASNTEFIIRLPVSKNESLKKAS